MDKSFYEDIVLTEEEIKAAILEGKKKKFFRERHKGHWPDEKDMKDTPQDIAKIVNENFDKLLSNENL